MAAAPEPRDRGDFHIVVLCALEQEAECVCDALDKIWDRKKYGTASSDDNAYTLGAIGEHNVVLIHMPGMGTDRATAAVTSLRSSFKHIKLALVVGVCGGMPYSPQNEEIILGDIIISEALVRYDFGKQYPQGFKRKSEINDILGPPTEKILGLLKRLKTKQARAILQGNAMTSLKAIQQKSPEIVHPGTATDILYHSSYFHQHRAPGQCVVCEKSDEICEVAINTKCEDLGCDTVMRVTRPRLTGSSSSTRSKIHFGTMASGNTVMKSGHHRNALAQEGIIAVEMEGAGAWRYGPTIVIKGVCDYADSHKRKNWQRYAAATAAACTKAFLLEWDPEKRQSQADKQEFNVYFKVPEYRVQTLFGREDELTKIATHFERSDDKDIDRPRMLVLQAMGGQGKSQIALEYCHRTRTRRTHHGIFWVDGSSELTTTQSLVVIAHHIGGAAPEALPNDESRAEFTIRTLESWEHRWLIVFDNCDDATTFSALRKKFLPKVGRGDLLFTSRHQGLEGLGRLMKVPPIPLEAGVQLLLHRYGADVNYDEYLYEGRKIVKRLGGLALAIDQASAYIQYKSLPLDQLHTFLPLFLAERANILGYTGSEIWNYMKIHGTNEQEIAVSAFTTWEMSFKQLLHDRERQDDITHFFTLTAYFGATSVHEWLFKLHLEERSPPPLWMKLFCTASEEILHTSATIQNSKKDSIAVIAGRSKDITWFMRQRKKIEHRFKESSHPPTSQGRSSPQQSQAVEIGSSDAGHGSWNSNYFWDLIHQAFRMSLLQDISPAVGSTEAGFSFHPLIRDWLQLRPAMMKRQAYTREAISILSSSIRVYTTRSSSSDIKASMLIHMNAALACDAEFFSDKRRLGCDESTWDDTYWFASFYRDLGKYDASLKLAALLKATRTRVLGVEHPSTLSSMNNLATVLSDQAKYSEAEQMHGEVLEVKKRVLGVEHPSTLTSMNNLAVVLSRQGKHSEAEQMHGQELEVSKRVLGVEHPSTLISMSNLALVLSRQGKYSEAEQMHGEVLKVSKRVLGVEHPSTLTSMGNLAVVLSEQGKYGEAEQIQRQVVRSLRLTLGPQHLKTEMRLKMLLAIWVEQGREASEIEKLLQDVTETASSP